MIDHFENNHKVHQNQANFCLIPTSWINIGWLWKSVMSREGFMWYGLSYPLFTLTFIVRKTENFIYPQSFILEDHIFSFKGIGITYGRESQMTRNEETIYIYIGLRKEILTLCNTTHHHICIFEKTCLKHNNRAKRNSNGFSFRVSLCDLWMHVTWSSKHCTLCWSPDISHLITGH